MNASYWYMIGSKYRTRWSPTTNTLQYLGFSPQDDNTNLTTPRHHVQYVVTEHGMVNLHGVVTRLKRLGYNGAISVEYEGPGDPAEALRRGLAHARALLN